jgi:hypothetical protein
MGSVIIGSLADWWIGERTGTEHGKLLSEPGMRLKQLLAIVSSFSVLVAER